MKNYLSRCEFKSNQLYNLLDYVINEIAEDSWPKKTGYWSGFYYSLFNANYDSRIKEPEHIIKGQITRLILDLCRLRDGGKKLYKGFKIEDNGIGIEIYRPDDDESGISGFFPTEKAAKNYIDDHTWL